MKCLILISLLVIIFHSCTCADYKQLQAVREFTFNKNELSYAILRNGKSLFKADITLYKHAFSGMLFIKQIHDSYRILFITEVGMKIFDLEITGKTYKVHYCVDAINKDFFIATIIEDVKFILLYNTDQQSCNLMKDPYDNTRVVKLRNGNIHNYYYINKHTSQLDKIESSTSFFKKITITFLNYHGNFPRTIHIDHHDLELSLRFNRLGETTP